MTAAHVVVGDYDSIEVKDLDGVNLPVASQPTYINTDKTVDLAILEVTSTTGYRRYLSLRTKPVLEGMNIVVVSNPKGFTGTVSTGIVSAVRDSGRIIQFTAPISNGSSGGPVLDFAHGVPLMQTAVANQGTNNTVSVWKPRTDEQQPPSLANLPEPGSDESKLPIPTKFGPTRRWRDLSFALVLDDQKAWTSISFPVYAYLNDSAAGRSAAQYLMGKLSKFYDLTECTIKQALDTLYPSKWTEPRTSSS
jgi:hypothetical protein